MQRSNKILSIVGFFVVIGILLAGIYYTDPVVRVQIWSDVPSMNGMSSDQNGNIFISGGDVLIKCNQRGDRAWIAPNNFANYDKSRDGRSICCDSDGNVYLISKGDPGKHGDQGEFVSRFDNNGKFIWSKKLDIQDASTVRSMCIDNSNLIYLLRMSKQHACLKNRPHKNYEPHVYIDCVNVNGDVLWTRKKKCTYDIHSINICESETGGLFLSFNEFSNDMKTNIFKGMVLKKINAQREELWSKHYDNNFIAHSLCQDSSDNIVLSGYQYIAGNCSEVKILKKVDSNGNEIWSKTLNLDNKVKLFRLITCNSSNDIFICVFFDNNHNDPMSHLMNAQSFLLKYDENGNLLKKHVFDIDPKNGFDIRSMCYAYNDCIYVTGLSAMEAGGAKTDVVFARFVGW